MADETLIPTLPNEVAIHCLARVPRRHHAVLSAVSKPIRSLLSSPEFYAARSRLGLSEEVLHLRLRAPFDAAAELFALHLDPDSRLAPLPPPPHAARTDGSAAAALGHSIYLICGTAATRRRAPSSDVWVLDCRNNTWSPGPAAVAARCSALAAVLGGRIFLVGGAREPFAEVLDPRKGRWEPLPNPLGAARPRGIVTDCFAAADGKLHVWAGLTELLFDPETLTWAASELPRRPQWEFVESICSAGDGALLAYHCVAGRIKWFDEGSEQWKDVGGAAQELPVSLWVGPKMVNAGGRVVVMAGKKRPGEKVFEAWCAEIKMVGTRDGRVRGEFVWSEKVMSRSVADVYSLHGPGVYFRDWTCFSISL